jgi:hypothetical protein
MLMIVIRHIGAVKLGRSMGSGRSIAVCDSGVVGLGQCEWAKFEGANDDNDLSARMVMRGGRHSPSVRVQRRTLR